MSEKKEKKKMKLWKKIVIGIVIVLVILLIAAYFIIRNMFSQPDIEAAKGTDETIVETDKGEIMAALKMVCTSISVFLMQLQKNVLL